MVKLIATIACCMATTLLFSQSGQQVFNTSMLHTINITFTNNNWLTALENDYTQQKNNLDTIPDTYQPINIQYNNTTLYHCGIKIKGNASYFFNKYKLKKSFKISFNEFEKQNFDGLQKIILNNGTSDPSFVREPLSYMLMRNNNLPAPRTAYAKLFINGAYWGLYQVIENIDNQFLQNHFGIDSSQGNLFKTGQEASVTLAYVGNSKAAYKNKGLQLKSNEEIDDWNGLIHFLDVINNKNGTELYDSLQTLFNTSDYLKVLAIEKMVNSWDSYWGGGNNFYLYQHPNRKFYWIPWDMNETFVDEHAFITNLTVSYNYLLPTNRYASRPLLKSIFSFSNNSTTYFDNVCGLLGSGLASYQVDSTLGAWHALIDQAVLQDPNKLYSYTDFKNSLFESTINADLTFPNSGIRVRRQLPGIFPFIAQRSQWAMDELKLWHYECTVANNNKPTIPLTIYPNPAQTFFTINQVANGSAVSKIAVYNTFGAFVQVQTIVLENQTWQVNIENLPKGIYFIKQTHANGLQGFAKFVKL
jgi:hypothetical protein